MKLCGNEIMSTTAVLKRGKNQNDSMPMPMILMSHLSQVCAKFHRIRSTDFPVKSEQKKHVTQTAAILKR